MQQEALAALLRQMSLEEKIGELFQLPSYYFSNEHITGPAAELGITDQEVQVSGSCLSIIGAEKLQALQATHTRLHPHHIPMLFMADIINGYRTVFPIPLAQGCTFDPAMVEASASVAAREAAAAGIHVTFSPMADLCRDARWGRVMESTGEDPYLNGIMAAAMVRGYQGKDNDLTKKGAIAACVKHFAGYGAPEGGRDYNAVELSERTLREDYLEAYQKAIAAGAALVMTSFNTLNRIPSSANRWLLRDVLRGEMQFDGVVISDWMALNELLAHGVAADQAQAARLALTAGVDIDMASTVYLKHLRDLVDEQKISEAEIDECVLRILTLKNKLGLFEHPTKDASVADEEALLLCGAHRAAARACAEESFVLLKNEGSLLPLPSSGATLALIGPYADNRLIDGAWSFFADDADSVTLLEGMRRFAGDAELRFTPGSPTVDPGVQVVPFQKGLPKEAIATPEALAQAIQTAVETARRSDAVVLALGEHREYSGECASRTNLTLPDCQMELLRRVSAVNPHICVVLFTGRPLDLREISRYAKAILVAWFPGTEGGNALARVLYGLSAPSGKLAMSFPYSVGQIPVYYSHMSTGRPLLGDYRLQRFFSQYLDAPNQPLYPFGYGLTYTTFACSPVFLDRATLHPGEVLHASVRVRNTGSRTGTETVQLYLHDVVASVTRPVRTLKGFQRVTLAPGAQQEVSFSITEDMLRFYNADMRHVAEPGDFELWIGFDSTTENRAAFVYTASPEV